MKRNFTHVLGTLASITALLSSLIGLVGCNRSTTYPPESESAAVLETEAVVESECIYYDDSESIEMAQPSPEETARERYQAKWEEVGIADIYRLYGNGKKVWYSYWTSENEYGYTNKLYVYNSETDSEQVVNLNKTSLEDDEMYVECIRQKNGILTIIMSEMRNSDGWVEGTYVWQYNCETGAWKPLAKACSGAEFINNDTAVKITYAHCLNPNTYTADKRYKYTYKTIKL